MATDGGHLLARGRQIEQGLPKRALCDPGQLKDRQRGGADAGLDDRSGCGTPHHPEVEETEAERERNGDLVACLMRFRDTGRALAYECNGRSGVRDNAVDRKAGALRGQ
jgi:hypothetical protein